MQINPYGGASPQAEPLEVELARQIGDADLSLLGALEESSESPVASGSGLPVASGGGLRRLRDSHHQLARLLARGVSNIEASSVTGYSASYISLLKKDPSFEELVAFYRSNEELAQADVTFRLTALNLGFIGELQDRLEFHAEGMSNSFVLEAVKVLSDRTGHAPMAKSLNVNVNLAGRLESARRRAAEASGPIIEGQLALPESPDVK